MNIPLGPGDGIDTSTGNTVVDDSQGVRALTFSDYDDDMRQQPKDYRDCNLVYRRPDSYSGCRSRTGNAGPVGLERAVG